MAGGSISPPGVEVIQEFVTTSPTIISPSLPTVLVAPAYQLVDAFDDNGNPQSTAFAGTYRDGQGVIAYNLPNLISQASLVGFEDDVRVFLVYGTETRELKSVSDEELIVDGATGDITISTLKLVDLTQLYTQIGVEAGDVVRITWRGEGLDIPIASVDSDTELTLEASILDENLTSVSYDIVRNPAEFVFDAVAQANAEIGSEANYLRFTAALLKEDGTTVGDYIGSAGDALSVSITDSEHFLDGIDGVIGDSIFTSATATFLADVGARGAVANELFYSGSTPDDGGALLDIIEVVSDTQIHIESGTGVGASGLTYHVGDDSQATYTADSGTTDATVGTGATLTVTGGDFLTSVGAAGPVTNVFVELSTGVYQVEAVVDNDNLTYFSSAASVSLTGENPVVLVGQATAADGATGALTNFATISRDLTTLADDSTEAINFGGTTAASLTSVTDADNAVVGVGSPSPLTSGPAQAFSAVLLTAPLTLAWDPDLKRVSVQLERAAGISASTFAEIEDAVENSLNASYNLVVSDIIDAALGGTVGDGSTILGEADLEIIQFDGGSDEESLLLDADLLQSATPTAQVYVTYKALRIDLSSAATEPTLLDISDQTQRESLLGPATTDNPLSLMVFYALTNSPGRSVKALGVSAVSATKPSGTLEAYTSAFEFLEGYEVYLIVPGTLDPSIAQALQTHVNAMSQPSEKSERVGFFNTPMPVFKNATILASGTDGNTGTVIGANPAEFSASVDFEAQGVQAGDILVVGSLAASDDSPDGVNGTVGPLYGITVSGIKSGDPFVLEFDGTTAGLSTDWNDLVDVGFTVYRAGAAISQASDQAEVIAQVGEGFEDRRMYHHWPDQVTADVAGIASIIDGYYCASAWGGKSNQVQPQQPFSRTTVAGFTGVKNSNGYFSKSQLDRIAGGGTWITYQEAQNTPLKCRHQLSTDVSSVERREFSITRIIDYTAKYMRTGLNKQVGKFNITQSYLDGLASAVQGLLRALRESGVLIDGRLVSIAVNDVQPDKVDIVIAIDVPYPANYIEVTLQV